MDSPTAEEKTLSFVLSVRPLCLIVQLLC